MLVAVACVVTVLGSFQATSQPAAAATLAESATSVTSPTVSLSTTAAGATGVVYTVTFTTSSSGALASGQGTITLSAPAGTGFTSENVQGVPGIFINDVYDVTAGQDLGYSRGGTTSAGGSTVTWTVEPNIPAGHEIRLTIAAVTNPGAGTYQLGISTSADTAEAQTAPYTITPAQSLTSPSVSVSSTAAGATGVTYTVDFTTSSTGELSGGDLTLVAPSGTTFFSQNVQGIPGVFISDVYDLTAGQDLGYSRGGTTSAGGSTVTWGLEPVIPAGHEIQLTIPDVTNPAAGTYQISLSTSSDPTVVSTAAYTITPPGAVSGVSVSLSSGSAGATGVTYVVQFTASSTGALVPGPQTQITLAAAPGTVFPGGCSNDYTVDDLTTSQTDSNGLACSAASGSSISIGVGVNVNAGDLVSVTVQGVTNPTSTGLQTLTVTTTSDAGASATYLLTGGGSVTGLALMLSSTAASASGVTYEAEFTTSPTGQLSGSGGATITLTAAPGTVFPADCSSYYTVSDVTSGAVAGGLTCSQPSGSSAVIIGLGSLSAAGGDQLAVTVQDVTNAPSGGSASFTVATSSDSAETTSYTLSPPGSVTEPAVLLPTTSVAGAAANYAVTFTTSATGAILGGPGSAVTIVLPSGTSFQGGGAVYDGSDAVGTSCSGTTTIVCPIQAAVNAGDTLTVDFEATNPIPGTYTLAVSTSSDPTEVTSSSYAITSPQSVTNVSQPTLSNGASGSVTTYSLSFTTSDTGGLSGAAGSTVTIRLPSGTTYTGAGAVYDGSSPVAAGSCSGTTVVVCPVTGQTAPGDTLTVSFDATNPPPGTYSLGVYTSSDTTEVTSPSYTTGIAVTVTATPDTGPAPLASTITVTPTDPDGEPVTYSLAFGDGTAQTATIQAPYESIVVTHKYLTSGVYTVAASVSDPSGQKSTGDATVVVLGQQVPSANAGEAQETVAGTAVTLDGSGSGPASAITSYQWNFGDGTSGSGAIVQHTYSQPGTYTATLTVTADLRTSSATTTVTVDPAPTTPGLTVTTTDSGGNPVSGVSLAIITAAGTRFSATTNSQGNGSFYNLPDGTYTVYAYASGYLPGNVTVTQTNGTGSGTIALQAGAIAQTSETATLMTEQQLIAAGLNPNDPANQQAYQVSVNLAVPVPNGSPATVSVNGVASGCGFSNVTLTGVAGGSSSGGCGTLSFSAGGFAATASVQSASAGQTQSPSIVWMFVPLSAQWTKQFFQVTVLVTNLAPPGNSFDNGTVALTGLPSGLSLAPTANPQSISQAMPSIAAGSSQSASWVLRGDAEGFYGLSAIYQATLDPGAFPLSLSIATAPAAIHVWGLSAIAMTVQADSTAQAGSPFHLNAVLTNVADIPLYNVAVTLQPGGLQNVIPQPLQPPTYTHAELDPGQSFTGSYVLVPAVTGPVNAAQALVQEAAGGTAPPATVVTQAPTSPLSITSKSQSGSLVLTWQAPSSIKVTGYQVFWTPNLQTPFGTTPVATVQAGTTSTTLSAPAAGYYAISTQTSDGPMMLHPAVQFTGSGQQAAQFTADSPPLFAVAGSPYSYTFQASGVPATINYALDDVLGAQPYPPWLSINSSTGTVTGTPPAGTTSFEYQVTASNGVSPAAVSPAISVTVTQPTTAPSFTQDSPPAVASVGVPYTYTFQATGNPSGMAYSLTGAPAWLSIGLASGVVSGTPPVGTTSFSYSVQAANGVSPAATAGPFAVSVGPDPTATTLTVGSATTYGAEASDTVAVTVATLAPSTLIPPGTVAVTDSGSPVCTITLKANGTGSCKLKATQLAEGNHSLLATYTPANASFASSVSAVTVVNVAAAATSVSLTSPATLTFGNEQAGKFKAKVTASGTPLSGTITVQRGPLTVCSAAVSAGGSATCAATSDQLPVGSYDLNAVFTPGNDNLLGSASAANVVMVAPATTKTTLSFAAKTSYGTESAIRFNAHVTATGVVPAGTVAIVSGGATLCTVALTGSGSCSLGSTQLPAGSYLVQAVFTPSGGDGTSASSSAEAVLTVDAAATTTSLTFTSPAILGSEQLTVFTVVVKASGITPGGTVEIISGSNTLCTATLASGTGSCAMTSSALPVGTYVVYAEYTPDNVNVSGSASADKNLKVK